MNITERGEETWMGVKKVGEKKNEENDCSRQGR
jgi:hypothetical protein